MEYYFFSLVSCSNSPKTLSGYGSFVLKFGCLRSRVGAGWCSDPFLAGRMWFVLVGRSPI
jgi:hypothetical protein